MGKGSGSWGPYDSEGGGYDVEQNFVSIASCQLHRLEGAPPAYCGFSQPLSPMQHRGCGDTNRFNPGCPRLLAISLADFVLGDLDFVT